MSIDASDIRLDALPQDERRGSMAMGWFIATEAALFVALFFSYFYLGHHHQDWPTHEPPKLMLASIMLGILLASSVVIWIGERLEKAGRYGAARLMILVTILMGLGFLALQVLEYIEHLKTLKPTSSAYGSIFYTITSFHGAHVIAGLSMLCYVLILPELKAKKPPFRPLHNAAMYWHFVDVVWVFVVGFLYYLAHFTAGGAG